MWSRETRPLRPTAISRGTGPGARCSPSSTLVLRKHSGKLHGFKAFDTDHFSIGAFDFQGDTTPVNLDPSATDYVELPSWGDRTIVFPAGAHIYFGNTRSTKTLEPR